MTTADLTLVNLAADTVTGDRVMPLGALHVAAAAEAAGFTVDLRDAQLRPPDQPLAGLMDTEAPVLGLSLMADGLGEALWALRAFRERHPDTLVVLGGAGPTEVADPLLRRFAEVDAVVRGEGEATVVELLRSGGRAPLAGLSLRHQGEVVHGPDRPRIADPDALPWPAGCRWDLGPYRDASLVTARGCPFCCTYCSIVGLWGRTMACRDPERVVDEMAWLAARKPGAFVHLEDDTFTVDRRRVVAICQALERRGLRLEWGCTARIDQVDEDLVRRMAGAGCRSVFVGIESGADRLRSAVHKGFTSRQVFAAVELLLRHFKVTAHYVWGFPDETFAELVETFLQVSTLTAMGAHARHSHLVPFPRAPLVGAWLGDPPDVAAALAEGRLLYRETFPFPRLFVTPAGAPWAPLVREHPEVFVPHHLLPTPDLEKKFAFVAEFGRFERAS